MFMFNGVGYNIRSNIMDGESLTHVTVNPMPPMLSKVLQYFSDNELSSTAQNDENSCFGKIVYLGSNNFYIQH